MKVTINTVDGKSARIDATQKEYLMILDTLQNESWMNVVSGEIEHIIATEHITTVTVSK